MALTPAQVAQLRKDGYSEAQIAQINISNGSNNKFHIEDSTAEQQHKSALKAATGEKYNDPPMGVAGYDDNGNPIIDPDAVTPAAPGIPKPPTQEAIDLAKEQGVEVFASVDDMRADAAKQADDFLEGRRMAVTPRYTESVDSGGPDTPVTPRAPMPSKGLEALTTQGKIDQILNQIDLDHLSGMRDPLSAMFSGMAGAKHVPYGGSLQQIAAMFGGGAHAAQELLKDNNRMKLEMNRTRLGVLGRQADREQRATFHEEDITARERAANKTRNPWMKVDGGLYNWETDSYKEIGEGDLSDKYMKVGDGLFNLETEQFETLPNDGTRPEWLPSHFESVKDYNQTTKSINEEARKDTKNFGVKRDYFNNTRAIVENNPNYANYSVAEANALVKNLEKMLDPQGAVLAAESDAYQQGAAMLKQAQKMVSQAEKGGTQLTKEQIKSIVDTTNTLYKAMQDDVQKVTDRYGRRYERQGIHKDSRYQFLPMLPGIGEKVKTPLPPFNPAAHGLTPIINKNRSTP